MTVAELEDDSFRVLSRPVTTETGPAVLHIAQNIDDLNDTVRNLTLALAASVPAVIAVLAALVWWLVGRTPLPVELIRAEVADISGRRSPFSSCSTMSSSWPDPMSCSTVNWIGQPTWTTSCSGRRRTSGRRPRRSRSTPHRSRPLTSSGIRGNWPGWCGI